MVWTYMLTTPVDTQSFETTAVVHWTSLAVVAERDSAMSSSPASDSVSKKTPAPPPPPPAVPRRYRRPTEYPLQLRELGEGRDTPSTRPEERGQRSLDSLVARAETVLPQSSTSASDADTRFPPHLLTFEKPTYRTSRPPGEGNKAAGGGRDGRGGSRKDSVDAGEVSASSTSESERESERERDRERVRGTISQNNWAVSPEREGVGRRDWYHRNQRQILSKTG